MLFTSEDDKLVAPREILLHAVLPLTEFSKTFLEGCLNRMGMSHHKYGTVAGTKGKVDHIAGAQHRIERYQEDGNKEWLMDAANMLMCEFMIGNHPQAHYRPTDSDESPGRVGLNGARSSGHNDSLIWRPHE